MPRKKPYSGKQKKQQLRDKRERKAAGSQTHDKNEKWKRSLQDHEDSGDSSACEGEQTGIGKEDFIFSSKREKKSNEKVNVSHDPRRYHLNFLRETPEEIAQRKASAQTDVIVHVSEKDRETSIEEIFQPGTELDMPQRPPWKYGISKVELEKREQEYFSAYLNDIHAKFGSKHLSYFEHNLETWRQLWRVLEMSDVVAMVADVRHPVLHFSPALYNYVVHTVNKPLILVLNKTDLIPAPVVVAWRDYFVRCFPKLHIITFTSFPDDVREIDIGKKKKRRPIGKRRYTTQIGPQELLQVCYEICRGRVNLQSWYNKIEKDLGNLHFNHNEPVKMDTKESSSEETDKAENEKLFEEGRLTIGFVGHPNVGKSSLMNGLIGKKVVSTSVTPGHTKYFQTYFLTETVMLCDCPGLVFPSLIAKQMQILSGIYPIAQVQEPYTPVGYLAARIPLIKLLKLSHPETGSQDENEDWTAWDISEAWAEKRGFYTAKGARPDVYRAANSILRMAVDGRLSMYMLPPGYTDDKEKWIRHPETENLLSKTRNPNESGKSAEYKGSSGDHEPDFSDIDLTESSSEEDNREDEDPGDGEGISSSNKFSILCGE